MDSISLFLKSENSGDVLNVKAGKRFLRKITFFSIPESISGTSDQVPLSKCSKPPVLGLTLNCSALIAIFLISSMLKLN
jgi:hypothetical protein